jgi:hypothetical protein
LVAPLRAHNDCCFDSRRLASGNFVITGITWTPSLSVIPVLLYNIWFPVSCSATWAKNIKYNGFNYHVLGKKRMALPREGIHDTISNSCNLKLVNGRQESCKSSRTVPFWKS